MKYVYKENYRIVTENPYNKEKLNGLGSAIYSEWKDSFVNIIQKNEIKQSNARELLSITIMEPEVKDE